MQENETLEEIAEDENDQEFAEFVQLKASAPKDVMPRLHKRVRTAQLGRDLFERQAIGFWAVIDAFLKLFFAPKKEIEKTPNEGEK